MEDFAGRNQTRGCESVQQTLEKMEFSGLRAGLDART
jgi:hypothetical protein